MKACPECGKSNAENSWLCDCGHEFDGSELIAKDPPPMPRNKGRGTGIFKALAVCVILLLILWVTAASVYTSRVNKYSSSSKMYVDDAVPSIVGSWDKEELLKRATLVFKKHTSDYEVSVTFSKYNAMLGHLVKYEGAKGAAKISFEMSYGMEIYASYTAEAEFERGKATVYIELYQHGGKWQIMYFHPDFPDWLHKLMLCRYAEPA